MKTSVDNIYACGDINGRIMLAHSAFKMGEVAAENAVKGTAVKCDLSYVPSCLYLSPEAASVGLTEEKQKRLIQKEFVLASLIWLLTEEVLHLERQQDLSR